MPNNPFDISKLNGITFEDNVFAPVPGSISQAGGSKITVGFAGYPDKPEYAPFNPGTISVISSGYSAGFIEDGTFHYIMPTFGSIQLSNFMENGQPVTLWIHGFTENGIILSRHEFIYVFDMNGSLSNYESFILSNYGFAPSSPVPGTMNFPATFNKDPSVYVVPVCFVAGTLLETESGPRAVEDLTTGDLVVTASGALRPVKWIGEMVARPARHKHAELFNPVRVAPHALGQNVPSAAVRLSPGHSVFIDGVLVPVGRLVNGATIVQENVEEVRYFHVELDTHDILVAEGLPCESYLDDGNRRSFRGGGAYAELNRRLDPKSWDEACAPVVAEGPQLVAIRERLLKQAEVLGWIRCEDGGLRVVADGVAITPSHVADGFRIFEVPSAAALALQSRAGILAQMMPALDDNRLLGVAISEVRVDGEALDLDDPAFGTGFYPLEQHGVLGWRWTDGNATLAIDSSVPHRIEIRIAMVAPAWRRDVDELRMVA